MFGILWLTVWATVGEAFYDDYWYAPDDERMGGFSFESQGHLRQNFTDSLRTFADFYEAARVSDDEEMTLGKARALLRGIKVFQHTGSSYDFDTSKGRFLPLPKGEKYCTMGRHTKVDCNLCTCVAGQLYMCTGMICPQSTGRPLFLSTCREGRQRKIDSCNYCYCRNGHEFCTNKDCKREFIKDLSLRKQKCVDGQRSERDCNRCLCYKGEEYCTKKRCHDEEESEFVGLREETCIEGSRYKMDACNYCYCKNGRETCTSNTCGNFARQRSRNSCRTGASKYISCNYCICYAGQWSCTRAACDDERGGNICKPNETKIVECNTCQCHRGGWICTLLKCASEETDLKPKATYLEKKESDESCITGDSKRIECNTCYCFDGTWACTLSSCPNGEITKPKYDFQIVQDTAVDFEFNADCDRGEVTQENCVSCICTGNLWKCYNTCYDLVGNQNAPLRQVKKRECKRLDVKYEKCNRCECRDNRWVCAQNKCYDEGIPSLESEDVAEKLFYLQHCTAGEERKKDACNICFCRSDQWYCQMKKCTEPTKDKGSKNNQFDGMIDGLKPMYKPKCRKNSKRKIDACNSCFCSHGKWFCENKHCETPTELAMLLSNKIPVLSNKCRTGHIKTFQCHRCVCYADGYKCTLRRKCRIDPMNGKPYLRNQCTIGSRSRLDACNYCYCNFNRKMICSNHSCPQYDKLARAGFSCEIGRRDRIDACNYCYCNIHRQWICTNNSCPELYEVYRRTKEERLSYAPCVNGVRRQIDACNYCLCLNGTQYCTEKDCSNKKSQALYFLEPPCYPGEVLLRPDPCNQCICLDSTVVCSKVPCVKRLPVVGDTRSHSCVDGDKYNLDDGCNYCVCQGGQDFCTSRACLVNERPSSPNSVCNEGEMISANDNCNLCVCVRGKVTCTDSDCSHGARQGPNSQFPYLYLRKRKEESKFRFRNPSTNRNSQTRRCIPGVMYAPKDDDPDCPNSCICDGNELMCTHRTCDNQWKHSAYPMSSKSALHNRYAKQLLKRENCDENQPLPSEDPCNSCICLNERKVCTIIACTDDDIYGQAKPKHKGKTGNMDAIKRHGPFCTPFTFFSPDNNRFCRNCFCLHNGLALCLLNLCKYSKDVPHHPPDQVHDICTPGETGYPTKCVSCTCSDQGRWVCTREQLSECNERNCDLRDEFQMGFQSFCAGCKCMSKEWYCEVKANPCKDYSHVTCPMGALIINPNQHCSLCLCGGYDDGSNNMCFTETKCVDQVTRHI